MSLRPRMCLFTNCSSYSACIMVLPLYPFNLPFFSSQPRKVTILGKHIMASVRDIQIAEALLTLCLAYYVCYETSLTLLKSRHYDFHVSRYGQGTCFMSMHSPYFPSGLHKCFYGNLCLQVHILLCNRQNIGEYKAYWLVGAPVTNPRFMSYSPYFP